jgi:hypothetical protein
LLCLTGADPAQPLPNGRFAVAVKQAGESQPPNWMVVPDSVGSSSYIDCSTMARVPGWDAGHPDDKRPSTLEIAFKVEGDAVVMTATAFLGGNFDVNDTPATLARLPRKPLGTYSARVNESVTLSGMTEAGLQPVTVEVATARDPSGVHPIFISEVPSVQIELTGQNREFFTLALYNVSSRAVTGYAICAVESGGASCKGTKGNGTTVISAGGTLTISYNMGHSGRETPNGFVADPDPAVVALKGVVFADGSVEGMGISPLTPEGMRLLTQ